MSLATILQALEAQAGACDGLGSKFSGAFLRAAQEDVEAGGRIADLFSPWEAASFRALIEDAVALRFLGAFHDLALSGEAPALAAHYPGPGSAGDARGAWAAAREEALARFDRVADFMSHEPQTNEVGRSACLLLGFMTLAAETGLPLRTVELGASAGLNSIWDRFAYRLGDTDWGDPGSPVRLTPEWRSDASPQPAPARVTERMACDRKPLAIADPVVRRRLQAYVWPDQAERLARLQAAIALALDAGVKVEPSDAADFAREHGAPRPGVATVIYHSVFWSYVPPEGQAAITAAIEAHGAAASADAPLAWLRMEPNPNEMMAMETTLTTWPGGQQRFLALSHPHGSWIDYRG
jgi:hypothetical protein